MAHRVPKEVIFDQRRQRLAISHVGCGDILNHQRNRDVAVWWLKCYWKCHLDFSVLARTQESKRPLPDTERLLFYDCAVVGSVFAERAARVAARSLSSRSSSAQSGKRPRKTGLGNRPSWDMRSTVRVQIEYRSATAALRKNRLAIVCLRQNKSRREDA
jgi:hypothetical protein